MFFTGMREKGRREGVGRGEASGKPQQEARSREFKQAEYGHREPKIEETFQTRLAETAYQDSVFP